MSNVTDNKPEKTVHYGTIRRVACGAKNVQSVSTVRDSVTCEACLAARP